jgi:hypothetical protein
MKERSRKRRIPPFFSRKNEKMFSLYLLAFSQYSVKGGMLSV